MRGKRSAVTVAVMLTMAACGSSSKAESGGAGAETAASTAAVATTAAAVKTTDAPAAAETTSAAEDPEVTEPATDVTEPAADDTVPTDVTTAVDTNFSGEGSGPFCDIVRELDSDDPISAAFDATDPAVAKSMWDDVSKAFGSLEDVAPDEIAGDVATLGGVFEQMSQFFAGFDYDMAAAGAAMQADPEMVALFSGEDPTAQNASDRLDAYGNEVCGLAS